MSTPREYRRPKLLLALWLLLPLAFGDCQKTAQRAPVPRSPDSAVRLRPRPRDRPRGVPGVPVSAPWWQKRHAAKVARVKRGGVDLLWIGDSITHGWEHAGKRVWSRYYARRKAVNLGFSGDQVVNVLWRIRHGEVSGISPRVVIVMIGTNDAAAGQRPATTAAQIRTLVAELRTRLPRSHILLLAIFPCGADARDEQRRTNAAVNRIIAKLDDGRRVQYLDLNRHFLTPRGVLEESVMPDLLHPSAKGYRIWARALEPILRAQWAPRR